MMNIFKNKKFFIWGTGKKASYFLEIMHSYQIFWQELFLDKIFELESFLDNNPSKQNMLFHDIIVKNPNSLKKRTNFLCIIAVMDSKEIVDTLKSWGYRQGQDFLLYTDFLAEVNRYLIINADDILTKVLGNSQALMPKPENGFIEVKELLSLVEEIDSSQVYEGILGKLIAAKLVVLWTESEDKQKKFVEMRNHFTDDKIIEAFSFYYGNDIDILADFFYSNSLLASKNSTIKTIGIYDERYYNGGAERFLSLIMPIYLDLGYNVVFFTDEIRADVEYTLPEGVHRIVLKYKYHENLSARLEEFQYYINIYSIDIMCYHNRFWESSFFYEMLFLKLQGISVLVELHLMFLMLINMKNGLSDKYHKIYRLADKTIVLSKENEAFWRALGVDAIYIPNPIENGKDLFMQPIRYKLRKGNTVLWIGRIEHTVKQVFDTVSIMRKVVTIIPSVKLKIVGDALDGKVLDHLKWLIHQNDLEKNIELCGYHTNVEEFYERADVMLMTSKVEAFPFIVAESKLYGIPLVLYELPYLELLKNGQGYKSVKQGDYQSAANEIIKLLTDDSYRLNMSLQAKESIRFFVEYDLNEAWDNVFKNINDEEKPIVDTTLQNIEKLLLEIIWKDGEEIMLLK